MCNNVCMIGQVETIADSYMVVGGAPVETPEHACYVCDMALDAVAFAVKLTDPSNPDTHIKLKIGSTSTHIVLYRYLSSNLPLETLLDVCMCLKVSIQEQSSQV